MKKFIQKLVLFVSPVILSAYFIDIFISHNLKKSNSYAHKDYACWNLIMDGKLNSDVVIYGSSRACLQINPAIVSDSLNTTAYNLGINGHNFWLQYLKHSLLLQNNTKPKLIIHSVDAFTLEKRGDLYNSEQFLPYMLFNDKIKKVTSSYQGFNFLDYEIPLARYYGKADAFLALIKLLINPGGNEPGRIKGYEAMDIKWTDEFEKAREQMGFYEARIDTPSFLLFEKYLTECKAKNIKIILVYTPEYIGGQGFIKNRNDIISMYKGFSEKFNIPFYDYSKDSLSFQRKYFYNSTHLNKTGTDIFAKELVSKIKTDGILADF